jgi:hypothetical protein
MREEIVIEGIYEHFKSTPESKKIYKVLGIAKTRQIFEDSSNFWPRYKVRDCESPDEEYEVLEQIADAGETKKGDFWIRMPGNLEFVVYKQLYGTKKYPKDTIWIRDPRNFLGRIAKEDGNKERRFTLISAS